MARTKLYDNWTWNRALPEPFDTVTDKNRTDVYSTYNAQSPKKSTLHPFALAAILSYMDMDTSVTSVSSSACAIGTQGNDVTVSEYASRTGEIHAVYFNKVTGKFSAGKFSDPSTSPQPYLIKESTNTGTALFFALMPEALTDTEFSASYNELARMKQAGFPDLEEATKTAAILCDNLYRRISYPEQAGNAGIKLNIPATGNISGLTPLNLQKGTYCPSSVLFGEFQILKPSAGQMTAATTMSNADFAGHYAFSERSFTAREQSLIPSLPEWYILPPEIDCICRHAKATTNGFQPMRNFMLRGPAGTGKTEGAKAIAAGLNLPYLFTTCSANSEIFDLLGQMMPDARKIVPFPQSYPTLTDIQIDPASAYWKLTGEYREDVTETETYDMLLQVIESNAAKKEDEAPRFHYVDTPLIEAIRNGYLIELQEPTVISNPGVLVGLNSLLDGCSSIVLPTGEVIRRHPDTVVVITTNTGYAGCRDMNQSVISRMNLIMDVEEPELPVLVNRVAKVTGCTDLSAVSEMAQTVKEISVKCKETMINDGCCGSRELISWVQSYMVCGNIMEAARYTVLPSVSSDPENRAEILATCLEQKFAA